MVITYIDSFSEEAVRSALIDLKIAEDFALKAKVELARETLRFLLNGLDTPPSKEMIEHLNNVIGFARDIPGAISRLDEGYSGTTEWIDKLIIHFKNVHLDIIAEMNAS